MDPTVYDSMVTWNLSLLSTEITTSLRHLILDWPTSLDSSMVHHYRPVEIDQTTDLDQMPESLLELDYELKFQQAVCSSKGKFHLSADYAEDMDEEASTMIPSGDSHRSKITWETQASVKTSLRHCTRITQSIKPSKDLVNSPLSDPPSSIQMSKFRFSSPQNVPGQEHYRLRMQDTADYLPSPPSQGSDTGATQVTIHYTISSQRSWWDRQQPIASSQIPWWHHYWSTFPRRIGPRSSKNRSRSWPKHPGKEWFHQWQWLLICNFRLSDGLWLWVTSGFKMIMLPG